MLRARWPYLIVATSAVLIALASYRFVPLGIGPSFPGMEGHVALRLPAFLVHVTVAPLALLLGACQFLPGLRARRPGLHRWTGRGYGLAVALGGVSALWLALFSPGGPVAQTGFGALGVLWLAFTAIALRHAVARRIALHRAWMVRSYALTLAAVTLRLLLPILLFGAGLDYAEAARIVGWACWVPNLIVAEWVLRSRPGAGPEPGPA